MADRMIFQWFKPTEVVWSSAKDLWGVKNPEEEQTLRDLGELISPPNKPGEGFKISEVRLWGDRKTDWDLYNPLEQDRIWLDFVSTRPTKSGFSGFVKKYGFLLFSSGIFRFPITPTFEGFKPSWDSQIGESLKYFQDIQDSMIFCLKAYKFIQSQDELQALDWASKQHILITEKKHRTKESLILKSQLKYIFEFKGFPTKEIILNRLSSLIVRTINYYIPNLKVELVLSRDKNKIKLEIQPQSLLELIWLQIAQFISGDRGGILLECPACGRFFVTGSYGKHKDAEFCGTDSCKRHRNYLARQDRRRSSATPVPQPDP
jgi:hypothetical protein